MTTRTAPTTSARTLDAERTEAFAERLVGVLNAGATALAVSVGHRTGLFDAMAGRPPATVEAIAAAAGLSERYVREWLGAVVTAGIVRYDPLLETFELPAEHAARLTRAAAPNNLAAYAQYVGVLGAVEDRVVACFRDGGGVPYEAFGRFHEVMAEDSGQTVLPALCDAILPLVPEATARLEAGIDVLDVGCGRGRALLLLAERFPRSRFTGYDLGAEAIADARREAARRGLRNVRFEVLDVAKLDEPGRYDLVTAFDAIHDQAKPDVVLANVRRALRPDGVFLMQDIRASSRLDGNLDHPLAPFLYTVSFMHCMTVSLASGGMGLGTMWGEERALAMLAEAGFGEVEVEHLPHDIQNTYFVVRPS